MFVTLRKILHLLLLEGRTKLYWLVFAVFIMGVLDMIGVASIFPFLNVLADPNVIQENTKLKWVYEKFNFVNKDTFLIVLGVCSFIFLVVNNILRAQISVALTKFSYHRRYLMSKVLLEKYLYEPYVFFLNRNTSELTTYLVSEVARVVSGALLPALEIFIGALTALLIVILLIVINPTIAFFIIGIIGGGYVIIYVLLRKLLFRLGMNLTKHSERTFKILSEAFGGVKDIKILGKEQIFIDKFALSVKQVSDYSCWQFIIFQLPRYVFEILVFGGILGIAIFIAVIQKNYQNVVPIVGLYAFAACRLMPILQQTYQKATMVRSSLYALEVVYKDYIECSGQYKSGVTSSKKRFLFLNEIRFRNVTFQYPRAQESILQDFNLTVEANTTIGLVGGSGAGKTTLIDILLGLLRPQKGELIIDGRVIMDDNLRSWQKNIGYVPQQIYLCDDTVTRNIAFGVLDENINHEAVKRAAQLASIHEFVMRELPRGYETEIGERGIRLSGGQRQRIGIARALYHDPSVLVFDEATSALDGITEEAILEAIRGLAHKKTIIIVAHRLSTVSECDVIYLLEQGRVVDEGTYETLLESNQQFRKMAKVYFNNDEGVLSKSE